MSALQDLLAAARALVADTAAGLRGDLFEEQVTLYHLAFSAAELGAAHEAFQVAARAGADESPLLGMLAETFAAEALSNVQHRFLSGQVTPAVLPQDRMPGWAGTIGRYLSSARLEEVGRAVVASGGSLPSMGLDDEKSIMRATFRRFADDVVAPLAERIHRQDLIVPDRILTPLKQMGCFGLSVPARYGGLTPDDREDSLGMVVVTEELSRGSVGAAGSLITRPEIMARALLEGGTEAQKQSWLPRLASGEVLCAISVTEPDTGSDVASVGLRATRVDGGWVLNGAKTWCTFAGKANAILVLARTDASITPRHKGLSLFVVEKPSFDGHDFEFQQTAGGKVSGRAISTLGYRGMHSYDMHYDDYFVPADNLIGGEDGEGRGFYFTMRGFMGGRLQTAARACGLMQAALEAALRYAADRQVFDRPVAQFPLSLVKFARMAAQLSACRHFTYQVARLMDGGEGQMEASLVKLIACRCAEGVTREALQIHGGMGYAEETSVSRYFADARVLSIFEGAEETLAIRVVGKALVEASIRNDPKQSGRRSAPGR
jgi:(2S)-methylsuccinyl-CoA dehydrogenase